MAGLSAFMAAVRSKESTDNYAAHLQNSSFYGAYQFGDDAFKETGYMRANGTWTGKNGITSYADWIDTSNPEIENIQDSAFLEWTLVLWRYIRTEDSEPLSGQTLNGTNLTISGIIAASHLVGPTAFRDRYINSGGVDVPVDGNNVAATVYIELFPDFDLSDITGVDPDIIPTNFPTQYEDVDGPAIAGGSYQNYFVDNHDLDNTFNRHSDDNIDIIGNDDTNDYPIHGGTGDDKFYGFGGNDTFYGASLGSDFLDGGADTDTLTYAEYGGFDGDGNFVSIENGVLIQLREATTGDLDSNFTATDAVTPGEWEDRFTNFENLTLTSFDDTVSIHKTNLEDMTIDAGDSLETGDTADFSGLDAGGITFDLSTGDLDVEGEGNHLDLLNFDNAIGTGHADSITGSDGGNVQQSGDGEGSVDGGATEWAHANGVSLSSGVRMLGRFAIMSLLSLCPIAAGAEGNDRIIPKPINLTEELNSLDKCVEFFTTHLVDLTPAGIGNFCWITRGHLTPAEELRRPRTIYNAEISVTLFDLNDDGVDDIIYSISDGNGYYCGVRTCHLRVIFRIQKTPTKQIYRNGYISAHARWVKTFTWTKTGAMGEITIKAGSTDNVWSVDISDVFENAFEFHGNHSRSN